DVDGLDAHWRETLVIPAVPAETVWLHPGIIAVLSALATSLTLTSALALEEWTWQRASKRTRELVREIVDEKLFHDS
ncbi:unnamed protein product, partial [marine sediment metagenome]